MNAVETALYSVLSGESTITSLLASASAIYNPDAKQGAAYPFLIFALMSGQDDHATPHRSRQLLYLIKAVSNQSLKEAGAIDDAVDAFLIGKNLTGITGWTNVWLYRENDVRMEEVAADSQRYWHAGGIYRIRITT